MVKRDGNEEGKVTISRNGGKAIRTKREEIKEGKARRRKKWENQKRKKEGVM